MNKHTPGPWWLGRDQSHFGSLTSIIGGSDSTGGIRSVAEVGGPDIDEAEANARLIAAAPDLLTACREFVRFAELPNVVDRGDYIRYQAKAIGAARAAIAKAEGNQ